MRHGYTTVAMTEGAGVVNPVRDNTKHVQIYSSVTRIYHRYRKRTVTFTAFSIPTPKGFPKFRTNSRNFAIQLNLLRIP